MEVLLVGGYTSTVALHLRSSSVRAGPMTAATWLLHPSSTLHTPLQVQEDWGEEELQ